MARNIDEAAIALENKNRKLAMNYVRTAAARHQFNSFSEVMKASSLILKDTFTAVGFMNTALNIMISRFGSMILVFGAVRYLHLFKQASIEAAIAVDTSFRKVETIVQSTSGNIRDTMSILSADMIRFTSKYGVAIEQVSDTMYFLASAGRESAEIHAEFAAVQKLVIATSKDMTTTMKDNKQLVETMTGLMNIYGKSIGDFNTQQERAHYLAGILFEAYRTNQILISELANGLTYSGAQSRAMNVSIEELIASLAVLNTGMIKGSKAGTSYANALRDTIRNADKLKQLFNIEIGDITKGFSFLEKVIKPINRDIRETGLSVAYFQRLIQVYNIRGARAVVALAIEYDRLEKLLKDNKHALEDLQDAVDVVNDSLKAQQQISKNLQVSWLYLFQTAITGGRQYAGVLKDVNDMKRSLVRLTPLLFLQLSMLAFGYSHTWRSMKESLEHFYNTVTGKHKSFDEFWEATRNTARKVAKDTEIALERIIDSILYTIGFMSEEQLVTREAERARDAYNVALEETDRLLKQQIGVMKSYIDILGSVIIMTDKTGARVLFPPEFFQNIEDARHVLKFMIRAEEFGEAYDQITAKIENASRMFRDAYDLTKVTSDVDEFFKFLNEKFNFATAGTEDLLIDTEEKLTRTIEMMMTEFARQEQMFTGTQEEWKREEIRFLNELIKLVVDSQKSIRDQTRKILTDEIEDVIDANNKKLREAERYRKLARYTIDGMRADKIGPGKFFTGEEKVSLVPTVSEEGLKALADEQTKIVKAATDEINSYLIKSLQDRFVYRTAVLRDIKNLEGQNTVAILQFYEKMGEDVDAIHKHVRDKIVEHAQEQVAARKAIIEDEYKDEQLRAAEAANKYIASAIEKEGELRELKKKYHEGSIKDLEWFWEQVEKYEIDIQNDRTKAHEYYTSEVARLEKEKEQKLTESDRKIKESILASFDAILYALRVLGMATDREVSKMSEKWDNISGSVQNVAKMFESTASIMSDFAGELDTMSEQILSVTSITLEGVSQIIDAYSRMQIAIKQGTEDFLATLMAVTSITSTILYVASQIIKLFSDEEDKARDLREEFLSGERARAVSADYGQAQVINYITTIANSWQFLDARQLTPSFQRELARAIYDEFVELQKSGGSK